MFACALEYDQLIIAAGRFIFTLILWVEPCRLVDSHMKAKVAAHFHCPTARDATYGTSRLQSYEWETDKANFQESS